MKQRFVYDEGMADDRMAEFIDRLARIRQDIARYATAPSEAPVTPVTLVAVTKYADVADMKMAYQAGVRDFGENRVQDALEKMKAFPVAGYPDLRWHFIGALQHNKVAKAVGRFHLIHSAASKETLTALSRHVEGDKPQPVLLQLNLSGDVGRHGLTPEEAAALLAEPPTPWQGVSIDGLMVIAPRDLSLEGNPADQLNFFQRARQWRDDLAEVSAHPLPHLSMGMTHDYVSALRAGATIIRIGNALFQNRELPYNK